jgi:hypothetical protein
MKKSELRQIIRECYTEVVKENQNTFTDATISETGNPFTDATISETGNPFTDATVNEVKLDKKFSKESDIDSMDDSAKGVYRNMMYAVEGVGEQLRVDRIRSGLMQVPLIRDVVKNGYMSFNIVNTYTGQPASITTAKIDYNEYEREWGSVKGRNMSGTVRRNGDELLQIIRKYDGSTTSYQEGDLAIKFSSDDGQDYAILGSTYGPSVFRPGLLKKIFTLGRAVNKVYISTKGGEAGGTFKNLENKSTSTDPELIVKFGFAIIQSVKRQGGTVTVKGTSDWDKSDEETLKKAKIGTTVKENRRSR